MYKMFMFAQLQKQTHANYLTYSVRWSILVSDNFCVKKQQIKSADKKIMFIYLLTSENRSTIVRYKKLKKNLYGACESIHFFILDLH